MRLRQIVSNQARSRLRWAPWLQVETPPCETHRVITADGVGLNLLRVRPQRPNGAAPVMLLHGLASNRHTFHFSNRSLANYLAHHGFETFVPELRGCGESGQNGWRWDLDDHIESDIPPLLDRIRTLTGEAQVHWIGHSMGGMLLWCYMIRGGGEGIRSGTTIGSALDFRSSPSEFRRLLRLRPVLRRMHTIRYGALVRTLAPLMGRVTTPIESFNVNMSNVEKVLVRQLHANVFGRIPTSLLESLASGFEDEGLSGRGGGLRYLSEAPAVESRMMMISGRGDRQVSSHAVDATAKLFTNAETRVIHFGVEEGHAADYGHFDLVMGREAPNEVWPEILGWLRENDETQTVAGGTDS